RIRHQRSRTRSVRAVDRSYPVRLGMANVAAFIAWMALAGALASWFAGAIFSARTPGARWRWLSLLAWPLGPTRAGDDAGRANKALVAFMVCLMIAAAAWSVAANLYRLAR